MTTEPISTDRLAEIREAASCLLEDGVVVVEKHGSLNAVTSQQAAMPSDEDDRTTVAYLCYTDTPEGAETIATMLRAVPRLLAEVERMTADLADARMREERHLAELARMAANSHVMAGEVKRLAGETERLADALQDTGHELADAMAALQRVRDIHDGQSCADREWRDDSGQWTCPTIRAIKGDQE